MDIRANGGRGAAAKGSIAGTHYDPTSATANRGASKKRPAPVPSGGAQRSKAGSQPSQQKKPNSSSVAGHGSQAASIVNMSEIEALRNYNKQMQEKMRQREGDERAGVAPQPVPVHQPSPAKVIQQQEAPQNIPQPQQAFQQQSFQQQPPAEESIFNMGQGQNQVQQMPPMASQQNPQATGSFQQQQQQVPQAAAFSQAPQPAHPIASITNPGASIYGRVPEKDAHQHAIVGSHSLVAGANSYGNQQVQKDQKAKNFADELKRQIEERDFLRKKEEWRKTKASSFMAGKDEGNQPSSDQNQTAYNPQSVVSPAELATQYSQPPSVQSPYQNPQNNAQQMIQNDKTFYVQGNNQQQLQQPPPNPSNQTAYGNNNQTAYANGQRNFNFDASITKQDFPEIKTRGRVDNRVDLDLERNGNILQHGRDEKQVMLQKREMEQQQMKRDLQAQIDEKQRKKDEWKMKQKQEELRDEQRVREQMKQLAVSEGMSPDLVPNHPGGAPDVNRMPTSTVYNQNMQSNANQLEQMGSSLNARKTAYAANQHSVSIMGSDAGRIHIPGNVAQQQQNVFNPPVVDTSAAPVVHGNERLARTPPQQRQISPPKANPHMAQAQATGQEESLMGLLAMGQQNQGPPVVSQINDGGPIVVQGDQIAEDTGSLERHVSPKLEKQRSSPQQQIKDQQINELSDMVKELLREQQELKEQLNLKESPFSSKDSKKPPSVPGKKPTMGLAKKASERVPRGATGLAKKQIEYPRSRERAKINPRDQLAVPLQNKPGEGTPKSNIKQTINRKHILENKRKEQQQKEQDRLDAIEIKIENARKRLEEKKKIKSQNAKNTLKKRATPGVHSSQNYNVGQDSDYGQENHDLDGVMDYRQPREAPTKFKSSASQQSPSTNIRSTNNLHSLKADSNHHHSPSKQSYGGKVNELSGKRGQHDSQVFNLDNEGTSQFTYPSQPDQPMKQNSVQAQPTQYANQQNMHQPEFEFQYDQTGQQWFNNLNKHQQNQQNPNSQLKSPTHVGNNSQYNPNVYQAKPPQQFNQQDSFDLEFMMPPDINSIDSDINKIGALTPSPFTDNFEMGGVNNRSFATKYPSQYGGNGSISPQYLGIEQHHGSALTQNGFNGIQMHHSQHQYQQNQTAYNPNRYQSNSNGSQNGYNMQ